MLALENDGQPYPPNIVSRMEVFAHNVLRFEAMGDRDTTALWRGLAERIGLECHRPTSREFRPQTAPWAHRAEDEARAEGGDGSPSSFARSKSTAPLSRQKRVVSHQVPKVHDKKYSDEKIDLRRLRRGDRDRPGAAHLHRRAGGALLRAGRRRRCPWASCRSSSRSSRPSPSAGRSRAARSSRCPIVYGGFHDTCLEYEIITAKGDVLTCTPDNEHSLIFQMMHGSFGTVGILSRLVFRLIPAKPLRPPPAREAHLDRQLPGVHLVSLRAQGRRLHGRDHPLDRRTWSLCVGDFVDSAPYTNRYDWLKVYYQSTATRSEDYLEDAALLLPLRPRGHQRPPQVVPRPAAARQVPRLLGDPPARREAALAPPQRRSSGRHGGHLPAVLAG